MSPRQMITTRGYALQTETPRVDGYRAETHYQKHKPAVLNLSRLQLGKCPHGPSDYAENAVIDAMIAELPKHGHPDDEMVEHMLLARAECGTQDPNNSPLEIRRASETKRTAGQTGGRTRGLRGRNPGNRGRLGPACLRGREAHARQLGRNGLGLHLRQRRKELVANNNNKHARIVTHGQRTRTRLINRTRTVARGLHARGGCRRDL